MDVTYDEGGPIPNTLLQQQPLGQPVSSHVTNAGMNTYSMANSENPSEAVPCLNNSRSQAGPWQNSGITTFVQPHMAGLSCGTSGFRTPTFNQGINGLHNLPSMVPHRVPVSMVTVTSGAAYQFPSPLTAAAVNHTPVVTCMYPTQTYSRPISTTRGTVQPGSSLPWSQSGRMSRGRIWNITNAGQSDKNKLPGKRKAATEPNEGSCRKVFVDEVRMSACMQELNLDNNNLAWHPDMEGQRWFSQSSVPNNNNNNEEIPRNSREDDTDDISDIEDYAASSSSSSPEETSSLPVLELSKDLNLSLKTKDLLPRCIVNELNKSQMQVVLWKAPGELKTNMPPADTSAVDGIKTDTLEDPVAKPVQESMKSPLLSADYMLEQNLPSTSQIPPPADHLMDQHLGLHCNTVSDGPPCSLQSSLLCSRTLGQLPCSSVLPSSVHPDDMFYDCVDDDMDL